MTHFFEKARLDCGRPEDAYFMDFYFEYLLRTATIIPMWNPFTSSIPSVTPQEAYSHLGEEGTILVDVREPHEVKAECIQGATNVPLGKIQDYAKELAKYKKIYVICRSGTRSSMCVATLHQMGITQSFNVEGGLIAWRAAGLPSLCEAV